MGAKNSIFFLMPVAAYSYDQHLCTQADKHRHSSTTVQHAAGTASGRVMAQKAKGDFISIRTPSSPTDWLLW